MKICVYAIAKDEANHVQRFCESASGADYIVIADTGSTDETVSLARENGAIVHAISIWPWRFDVARNTALALVPADADVCVSLDLDEVLEPGWREEIERLWSDGVTRIRHRYAFTKDHVFYAQKVHARHGYVWKYPCHEFQEIDPGLTETMVTTDMLLISHHQDRAKSRGQYLDILRRACQENPNCARSAYYYARELYYDGRWQEAISGYERYLAMPGATWNAERCFARRVIGECHDAMGAHALAECSFRLAVNEHPDTRDPWLSLARHYYARHMWSDCYAAAMRCLAIETRTYEYTSMPASWSHEPHDLAAISAWHIGLTKEAIYHGHKAHNMAPDNERLSKNLEWYLGERHVTQEAAE